MHLIAILALQAPHLTRGGPIYFSLDLSSIEVPRQIYMGCGRPIRSEDCFWGMAMRSGSSKLYQALPTTKCACYHQTLPATSCTKQHTWRQTHPTALLHHQKRSISRQPLRAPENAPRQTRLVALTSSLQTHLITNLLAVSSPPFNAERNFTCDDFCSCSFRSLDPWIDVARLLHIALHKFSIIVLFFFGTPKAFKV